MVYTCNPHFKKTQNNQTWWHMPLNANTQEVEGLVKQFDYLNSISCSQKGQERASSGELSSTMAVLCAVQPTIKTHQFRPPELTQSHCMPVLL